MSVKGNRIDLS